MAPYAKDIADFFVVNLPGAKALAVGGPVGLLWAVACLMLAGFLKEVKADRFNQCQRPDMRFEVQRGANG